MKYVIRVRSKYGIADKFNINSDEEADFTANILLTRKQTNEVKANSDLYRYLAPASTFDFLPKGSKDTYPLKFRIIRIKITEGQYETIVTNLWYDEFSAEDIKHIYKLRWGIETSFRELKYHIGLIAFHSEKKDCVIQEIFSSLVMYNFSMLITENVSIDDDKHNKYRSRANYAAAIHICIYVNTFFRQIIHLSFCHAIIPVKCTLGYDTFSDHIPAFLLYSIDLMTLIKIGTLPKSSLFIKKSNSFSHYINKTLF